MRIEYLCSESSYINNYPATQYLSTARMSGNRRIGVRNAGAALPREILRISKANGLIRQQFSVAIRGFRSCGGGREEE